MAYLDETGLARFWYDIKQWIASALSNLVHRTGNESIDGVKTFSNAHKWSPLSPDTQSSIQLQSQVIERGVVPSEDSYVSIIFKDRTSADHEDYPSRLAAIEVSKPPTALSSNSVIGIFKLYDPTTTDNAAPAYLRCGITRAGVPWAACPSTRATGENNDIVTRDWIPQDSRILHTSGGSVTGDIESTGDFKITRTATIGGVSTTHSCSLSMNDSSLNFGLRDHTNEIWILYCTPSGVCTFNGNASTATKLAASKTIAISGGATGTATAFDGSANITIPVTGLDMSKANAGTLPVARGGTGLTSLATFVRTTGDQEIGGSKVFTNDPVVKQINPIYYLRYTNFTLASPSTSEDTWGGFYFCDKNNAWLIRTISETNVTNASTYATRWVLSLRHRSSSDDSNGALVFEANQSKALSLYCRNWSTRHLGTSSNKWSDVYASNGTIQTSDERFKTQIRPVEDALLDAWAGVDFALFKFTEAVDAKGVDRARIHGGAIAQRVRDALSVGGLDAARYGFFCYDSWEGEPERVEPDGTVRPAVPAGDSFSLRYDEVLCIEAAYQRRENARLKKRVADLEERLAALELRLGSE